MATIQLLQGTEKIKDSYTKINTSVTNLNNAKMEKTADSDLNMNNRSVTNINTINLREPTSLTIDSNKSITVNRTMHRVTTSGGADELHTINGGNENDLLLLRIVSASNSVTIKHGMGNINTPDGVDISLTNVRQWVLMVKTSADWHVIASGVGLNRAGDTMTGNLTIEKSFPALVLNDTNTAGVYSALTGYQDRISVRIGGNSSANEVLGIMTDGLLFPPNGRRIVIGTGSPQGVVTAPAGSIYLNTSGGASTTIWVKESGTGNTGWVAK